MTLEAAFTELHMCIEQLEQTLDTLLWAVVQAQPEAEQGHVLVDRYDAATHDLLGLTADMRLALRFQAKSAGPLRVESARAGLTFCQDHFNRLSGRCYGELVSFEWIDALHTLARTRGGEWAIWVQGVTDALNQCPQPLYDVNQALFCCWCHLVDRASHLGVTRHSNASDLAVHLDRERAGKL